MQEHSRYEEVMEGKEWPQRGSGGKREDNVWHKALHYLHVCLLLPYIIYNMYIGGQTK